MALVENGFCDITSRRHATLMFAFEKEFKSNKTKEDLQLLINVLDYAVSAFGRIVKCVICGDTDEVDVNVLDEFIFDELSKYDFYIPRDVNLHRLFYVYILVANPTYLNFFTLKVENSYILICEYDS